MVKNSTPINQAPFFSYSKQSQNNSHNKTKIFELLEFLPYTLANGKVGV